MTNQNRPALCYLLVLILSPLLLVQGQGSSPPVPKFSDVAGQAGLVLAHDNDMTLCAQEGSAGGSSWGMGAAWGDYDGDEDLDLFVTNFSGPQHLYRNDGSGRFTDVAAEAGVRDLPIRATGVTFVDYDNDGDKDLYVLARGPNVLLQNNGDGTFTDVTAIAGIGDPLRGLTAAWGDYDNDGYVDLYVANHATCLVEGTPTQDRLYHNNGDGTFTDVTRLLNNAGPQITGYGFTPGWLDGDGDGDPDLYVVNDHINWMDHPYRNVLWRNDGPDGQGGWIFTDVSEVSKTNVEMNGMGLAIGDFNNDGLLDLAASNIGRIAVLRNRGDGTFEEVSSQVGAGRSTSFFIPMVTWSIGFFDLNNDGWQDLHLVAGYLSGAPFPTRQPDILFLNTGTGAFTDVSDASGAAGPRNQPDLGRASAYADYDRDGFVDIFVGGIGEAPRLYRNTSRAMGNTNHWLIVELKGTTSNRDGIGAKVRVTTGGLTQLRQIRCGTGMGAGDMLAAHFGLKGATRADRVEIAWPSGLVQTLTNVPVDQWLVITEP